MFSVFVAYMVEEKEYNFWWFLYNSLFSSFVQSNENHFNFEIIEQH